MTEAIIIPRRPKMDANDPPDSPENTDLDIKQKLNLETGQLSWPELQTFFARGIVIVVAANQDLLETAARLHNDEKESIQAMIEAGEIIRANDDHARDWLNRDPLFWSVVVAPWVLVQEKQTRH